MRQNRWVSLVVLFLAAFAGCSGNAPSAQLSAADSAAIRDSLRSFVNVFASGINALDVDRQLRLFANDPELTWAGDGQVVIMSRDSLGAMYRGAYKAYRKMEFTWDTLRTSVLGPDAGVITAAGRYTVTDTTGKIERKAVVGTYVFVRRNNTWQLLHGHASHRAM